MTDMTIEVIEKDVPIDIVINRMKDHNGICAVTGSCWSALMSHPEFILDFQASIEHPSYKNNYYMGRLKNCAVHLFAPTIALKAAFEKYANAFCLLL